MSFFRIVNRQRVPRLWVAALPIVVLLLIIAVIGLAVGAQRISDYTVYSLVATLNYLPYCVFNYLTPLVSILIARIGFRTQKQI